MSKMNRKKNGPGDKVHTVIDKNCTLKQIKNNKVLRTMQLDKAECARRRKELKTKNKPETTTQAATQSYKSQKGPVKPAELTERQIAVARQNYIKSNDKKAYLQSLPKITKDALAKKGIK